MEIITEPQFRALTNNKSVFFTNHSPREGVMIKFTDASVIVIHSDGLSTTYVDYFDGSRERRAFESLGKLARNP